MRSNRVFLFAAIAAAIAAIAGLIPGARQAEAAYTFGNVSSLPADLFVSQWSGDGALELRVNPSSAFQLLEVRTHLASAGTTQTQTVTLNHNASSACNVVLDSQSLVSATDHVFRPAAPCYLQAYDYADVYWANSGGVLWGCTVVWRKVH